MKKRKENISYLLDILWKEDKMLLLCLILDIVIAVLAKYPNVVFPKYIIDLLIGGERYKDAVLFIFVMIGLDMILSLIGNHIAKIQKQHSKRLEFQLHTNVTNKTLAMPYEMLLDADTYDKMYLASDIANGNNFMNLMDHCKNFFVHVCLVISMGFIIARVDLLLMLITFVVVIMNAVTDSKIQNQLFKTKKDTSQAIRKLEYVGKLAWHMDFAKEVRLFRTKDLIYDKYYKLNEFVLQKIFRDYQIENNGKSVSIISGSVQMAVLYLVLGWKLFQKVITVGDFTLYMGSVNLFKSALDGLLHNIIGIAMHSKHFMAYVEYVEMPVPERKTGQATLTDARPGFCFQNVSFRYPGQTEYALRNVSAFIAEGEKISLAGENGAGKTTFILLLLKLIEPTSGNIYYNGQNIHSISDENYWKNFSTVFQDFNIYHFSVLENIKMDLSLEDPERITEVLRQCGMMEEISSLKAGLASIVGHEFSKEGIDFSGGQRQKLAIARAMYRDGAVMILDEPTAALDVKAESEIFMRMKELSREKTAIFITHRLYSVRFCDRIFFFSNGKIAEAGTHEELMKKKGEYYEMYRIQAQYFEEEE